MSERMRNAADKLRGFNRYSGASDPGIRMAILDLETAGLGSFHSNFGDTLTTGEMRRLAKKHGMPMSQMKEALSYKSSPIWEVGLSLPGQTDDPMSFVNRIDGKLEKGAEDLMSNAKIKGASGKEVTLKKFFDHIQKGDISKSELLKEFSAELMTSEKATLEHVVTNLKKTNTTHLAGWNIGGFDMKNMLARMQGLGISDSDIGFVRNLKVVDYLDDAEDLVQIMTQPYEKTFGQYLNPADGKGLASSPRFRKGFTQLSAVSKLFPGAEHSAHRAGTKGGDVAITKHIGKQIEKFKSGDKGAMRNVMRGMNDNIVGWYDNHVKLMAEDGMDTAFELGKGREELLRVQKEVDVILRATGEDHPLALRKAYGTAMDKYESLSPAELPTGAEIVDRNADDLAKLRAAEVSDVGNGAASRGSTLRKDMTNEISDMASKATKKVFDAMEDGLPRLKGAWDNLTKGISNKHIAGAALVGGIVLAHKAFDKTGDEGYEGDFMDAGMLGMNESDLRKAIMKAKGVEGFNSLVVDRNKRVGKWNSMAGGREVHEMIQRESGKMSEFVGVEVAVTDKELGIKGMVDLVVRQEGENIPIEIKTVETVEDLEALERPKDSHISQQNFYSHAMGSSGGYIMYAARADPSKRKTFYQPYSAGQLVGDVHKFRSTLTQAVKSDPSVQHYWKTHIQNMGWETPLGVRPQSRQGYGGRDAMKGNSMFGFPGGREQTFSSKETPKISFKGGRGRSKIRDQSARNRFSGMGHPRTPIGGNFTTNPAARQSDST